MNHSWSHVDACESVGMMKSSNDCVTINHSLSHVDACESLEE